jgi:acyl-CoA synthetase (NDP forming)
MVFGLNAQSEGLRINKSGSYGNGIVLDASNFLEYFDRDPEIKIIGMYLEGIKNGRRFFEVLRKVAANKPVVIWKGGTTADGGRAIASHTSSLAIPSVIWQALMKQCGAVSVGSMEELIDTLKMLLFCPLLPGNRMGAIGGQGGQSITITDMLASSGFEVPLLTPKSYNELSTFFSLVGGSYRNPVDTDVGQNRQQISRIFEILERDSNIDILMLITRTGNFMWRKELSEADISAVTSIRKKTSKPVIVILPYANPEEMIEARGIVLRLQEAGIPAFPTMERAVRALANTLAYTRFKKGMEEGLSCT